MTVKETILKLTKKWRVYDQISRETLRLKDYRVSFGTIDRKVRELVEEGKLIARRVKGKQYKEFRRA